MILVRLACTEGDLKALELPQRLNRLGHPLADDKLAGIREHTLLLDHCGGRQENCGSRSMSEMFEALAPRFDAWIQEDEVCLLVAKVLPFKLNPLSLNNPYESLLASLILAFPEVRWLFGGIRGYGKGHDKELDDLRNKHGLHQLFKAYQAPLFDGQGLRDWVKRCARESKEHGKETAYLTRRAELAVAMDEEIDYAYLHAFTAYRFGFRALPISRFDAAKEVLGKNSADQSPQIVFEDLYLNFPDRGGCHLSKLSDDRKRYFPRLEKAECRILVTSGHRVAGDAEIKAANRQYIAEQRRAGKHIRYLYKPHAGIFSVWEKSGLKRKLTRGVGKGFEWPPKWEKPSEIKRNTSHSSPGILLLIARHMLHRAEVLLAGQITSAEEAVRGAVLATDALELLGGKTPTTAAEALSLKHQLALHAECQFVGVKHHVPLKQRFEEIERDSDAIAHWFHPREKVGAKLDIQMDIINRLVRVLRHYNQFDEELTCINKVRHLHNSIYMRSKPWRYIFWPFLRYSEFLLSSFLHFLAAIAIWTIGLSLIVDFYSQNKMTVISAVNFSVNAFFASTPIYTEGTVIMAVSVIAVMAGLAHLGIFLSHLYTLVSKR